VTGEKTTPTTYGNKNYCYWTFD